MDAPSKDSGSSSALLAGLSISGSAIYALRILKANKQESHFKATCQKMDRLRTLGMGCILHCNNRPPNAAFFCSSLSEFTNKRAWQKIENFHFIQLVRSKLNTDKKTLCSP